MYRKKVKNATWYLVTNCSSFTPYLKIKTQYIEQLKNVIANYLASNPKKSKRELLNLGGDNLKFLFRTLTQSDAQKYTQHIQELESKQQLFLKNSQE